MEKPPSGRLSYFVDNKGNYMMSIAFTKEVVWKGKMRVSHSQCAEIAQRSAAVDATNTIHQMPLYFFCSMSMKYFGKCNNSI